MEKCLYQRWNPKEITSKEKAFHRASSIPFHRFQELIAGPSGRFHRWDQRVERQEKRRITPPRRKRWENKILEVSRVKFLVSAYRSGRCLWLGPRIQESSVVGHPKKPESVSSTSWDRDLQPRRLESRILQWRVYGSGREKRIRK